MMRLIKLDALGGEMYFNVDKIEALKKKINLQSLL